MKKLLALLLILVMCASICMFVASCDEPGEGPGTSETPGGDDPDNPDNPDDPDNPGGGYENEDGAPIGPWVPID